MCTSSSPQEQQSSRLIASRRQTLVMAGASLIALQARGAPAAAGEGLHQPSYMSKPLLVFSLSSCHEWHVCGRASRSPLAYCMQSSGSTASVAVCIKRLLGWVAGASWLDSDAVPPPSQLSRASMWVVSAGALRKLGCNGTQG